MGLFDFLKGAAAIRDADGLAAFIESRSSHLVQMCIWEYARARSGIVWEKLFREPAFKQAVNHATWTNLPLCLGHVCEMVEGELRPLAGADAMALTEGLITVMREALRRFEGPGEGFPAEYWADVAARVEMRIRHAGLAAPKDVKDIPIATHGAFMEALPIHESLRVHDVELVRNHLRLFLCKTHEDWLKQADKPALAALLVRVGREAGAGAWARATGGAAVPA